MIKKMVFASVLALMLASSAYAAEAPAFSETLTGNWGGSRTDLYNRGILIEGTYKLDVWENFSGGASRTGTGNDNLDLQVTLDGEKLFGQSGLTIFLYGINNMGGTINEFVSSNGGIDNIEVPEQTAKLHEAWIEQNIWDDQLSIKAGLYDLNTEFYVTDTSGLFINPTYGIGTEMAATGDNGPSIFPTTSLSTRVKYMPTPDIYAQVAALDAVPGDVNNDEGTHIQFEHGGVLWAGEVGYAHEGNGHYGIGACGTTQINSAIG